MPSGYGLNYFFTALLFSFIRFYHFFLIFEHYSGPLVILQDYLRVVFVRMGWIKCAYFFGGPLDPKTWTVTNVPFLQIGQRFSWVFWGRFSTRPFPEKISPFEYNP